MNDKPRLSEQFRPNLTVELQGLNQKRSSTPNIQPQQPNSKPKTLGISNSKKSWDQRSSNVDSVLSIMGGETIDGCDLGFKHRCKPCYVELDHRANKEVPPEQVIHWLYGDVLKKYSNAKTIKDPKNIIDLSPTKKSAWVSARKRLVSESRQKTYGEKLDDAEEKIETADGYFFWTKFVIVMILVGLYAAGAMGYLKNWTVTCNNDIAQHN
jgi:hypothetical protein